MDYEKEFNVTAEDVKKEVNRIKIEKVEYDEYGKFIPTPHQDKQYRGCKMRV